MTPVNYLDPLKEQEEDEDLLAGDSAFGFGEPQDGAIFNTDGPITEPAENFGAGGDDGAFNTWLGTQGLSDADQTFARNTYTSGGEAYNPRTGDYFNPDLADYSAFGFTPKDGGAAASPDFSEGELAALTRVGYDPASGTALTSQQVEQLAQSGYANVAEKIYQSTGGSPTGSAYHTAYQDLYGIQGPGGTQNPYSPDYGIVGITPEDGISLGIWGPGGGTLGITDPTTTLAELGYMGEVPEHLAGVSGGTLPPIPSGSLPSPLGYGSTGPLGDPNAEPGGYGPYVPPTGGTGSGGGSGSGGGYVPPAGSPGTGSPYVPSTSSYVPPEVADPNFGFDFDFEPISFQASATPAGQQVALQPATTVDLPEVTMPGGGTDQARTDEWNTYLMEEARAAMANPSRYDAEIVQQGQQVIQNAINELRNRSTSGIEQYSAGRGLVGSSLEFDQMRDMERQLREEEQSRLFELGREQALTFADDRNSAFGFGSQVGSQLQGTEDMRTAHNLTAQELNLRRSQMLNDESYRNRVLDLEAQGMNQADARERARLEWEKERFGAEFGLEQDRFGFDVARVGADRAQRESEFSRSLDFDAYRTDRAFDIDESQFAADDARTRELWAGDDARIRDLAGMDDARARDLAAMDDARLREFWAGDDDYKRDVLREDIAMGNWDVIVSLLDAGLDIADVLAFVNGKPGLFEKMQGANTNPNGATGGSTPGSVTLPSGGTGTVTGAEWAAGMTFEEIVDVLNERMDIGDAYEEAIRIVRARGDI